MSHTRTPATGGAAGAAIENISFGDECSFISRTALKKQAELSNNSQVVGWLFEDAAGAMECLTKAYARAYAATGQKELAGAIWSMRARLGEIALALDGIERLAAPQPDEPRFWIRIAGKKFYQSRSFYLSEDSGNEIFRRAGRLETRDDNRRAGL